jgi:hemoglobin
MQGKKDIEGREDIERLISAFYTHAMQDELIGSFFTEIAAINLAEHLPIMYDFWDNLLFHTKAYQGGMMYKHLLLDRQQKMQDEHFERWLMLFEREVDDHFSGPKADEARQRAHMIASTMRMRMNQTTLPFTRK